MRINKQSLLVAVEAVGAAIVIGGVVYLIERQSAQPAHQPPTESILLARDSGAILGMGVGSIVTLQLMETAGLWTIQQSGVSLQQQTSVLMANGMREIQFTAVSTGPTVIVGSQTDATGKQIGVVEYTINVS